MKKIAILSLIATCLNLYTLHAQAIDDENLTPDMPVLTHVSIDPMTGYITVHWYPKTPAESPIQTDGYIIYWHRENPGANFAIDTIWNPSQRNYTFDPRKVNTNPPMPDPNTTTVSFAVAAVHKSVPRRWSTRSDEDYTMSLSLQYDSCRAEFTLSWNPYRGWHPNREPYQTLKGYRIMQIPEGGGIDDAFEVKQVADQDTATVLTNIEENQYYSYFIEAISDKDEYVSTSHRIEKVTKMPIQAQYVTLEGVHYDAAGLATIDVTLDPNSETTNYELTGSAYPDNSFVPLQTLTLTGSEAIIVDKTPREQTFYYRLGSWHTCKNRYVVESNTATALWMQIKQENDNQNLIIWDSYMDWQTETFHQIHRKNGSKPEEIIYETTDVGHIEYFDDFTGMVLDGDLCYYISARPVGATNIQEAVSNTICLKPESDIFIPKAFTPNADGKNDVFQTFFSYPPADFVMYIYDRLGNVLFQTTDYTASWDGTFKNGKVAPEGVYVYFLQYTTARGKRIEKRGPITLLIPRIN